MIERVKLNASTEEEKVYRVSSREKIRNALGTVPSSELENIQEQLERVFKELETSVYIEKRHGTLKFTFEKGEIISQVNELSKNKPVTIGFFLEDICLADGTKDTSYKMVWIYFPVKHKALTHLKQWLLANVFEVN